ncbi:hypothetical protein TNCT_472351 [Trichonephila clavata]|uniref:Uncharacterized protein n=1 Tax=Trichonephila clavata TaxID=2740835 RepID=A0A8X6GD60_TRICU|nr:hypothetical protein TNCT_472351 [Trichonephila clavata]
MFLPQGTTFTGVWKVSDRTVDPLTLLLMHAGRSYRDRPPVYAVGIVMFLPTRHDIHRVVEGFRTRTVDPLTLRSDACGTILP